MPLLSFFRQLPRRRRLIVQWAVTVVAVLATVAGLTVLERTAADQSRAYQTDTARAFGEQQERWLSSPKDPSEFEAALQADQLSAVAVDGPMVLYTLRDGSRHSTRLVSGPQGLVTQLEHLSVDKRFALTRVAIDARAPAARYRDALMGVPDAMLRLAPLLLMAVLILLVARQSGLLSRDGLHVVERPDTRFGDVIGATEAKQEFQHVVSFLQDPQRYTALGATAPRGVLLEGPPGTGKTLLARAVAGECGANFIAVDGASFSSMYYGMGITKVKQLFAMARRQAPCIVFIDEADGIGMRVSGEAAAGGVAEQNRIINRILVEMDGFNERDGVVVLAATNHVQNIDPALRRPGRFDRSVRLVMPVQDERRELFAFYLRGVPHASDVDCDALSTLSQGMSPADVANAVNRAASRAARDGSSLVTQEHVVAAIEEHQLGGAVSAVKALLQPATRERIARHEAGHALAAVALGAGRVERVTIEPRGQALGVTFVARHTEEPLYREQELHARLAMLLAGRQAELDHYGDTSSGAADDLKRATELAVSMAGSMGLGKTFGLLSLTAVPREFVSPQIQEKLLDEAQAMLENARARCAQVLALHRETLDALADALIRDETVSGPRLAALLDPVAGAVPASVLRVA